MAKAEQAGGVASATPEAATRIMIPLDLIVIDKERERLGEDPELDQLVASMRVDGLLQPVGVLELGRTLQHQKHRLVFGHRRFAAAKRLGWKAIEATIVVLPENVSEDDVLQVRAIENLQRKELNPAEEAVMVAQLLDALAITAAQACSLSHLPADECLSHPKVRAHAYQLAAAKLAKSETWVRDRAFIGRLDGKARDLVLSGRLPLAHAREISKLADPGLRAKAAVDFAGRDSRPGSPWPTQPSNLDDVKHFVEKHMFSLAQVPWKTDVRFAGKPACDDCPHNSANNPGLFDGGAAHSVDPRFSKNGYRETQNREPNAGVCTFESCFKEKAAASNGTVSRVAMKYNREQAKLPVKDRVEPTPKAVASLVPEFLKPVTIAAAAKDRWADMVQAKKPSTTEKPKAAPKHKDDPALAAARQKLRNAHDEWCRTTPKKLVSALKDKPLHLLVLFLLEQTDAIDKATTSSDAKAAKALAAPGVLRLINLLSVPELSMSDLETVARSISPKRVEDLFGSNGYGEGADEFVRLCGLAMGMDVAAPKLEDFLPKPKSETPATKPAAKSPKLTKVKIRETKCTGTCGRTEAELKKAKVEWSTDAKTICDECADGALDGDGA